MADIILKRCSRCHEHKPTTDFYKAGKAGYCILCEKAYKREHYKRNAGIYRARSKVWAKENPERKSATDRAWRDANQERCAINARDWAAKNPERRKAIYTASRTRNLADYRQREASYREQHRAVCNARIKEWKKRNPHAIVFYAGKRRAAQIQAMPAWANLDAIAAIYKACGAGHHVDHMVPLISPLVCGLHCEANLQILTASENSRKNNRVWPDMWV